MATLSYSNGATVSFGELHRRYLAATTDIVGQALSAPSSSTQSTNSTPMNAMYQAFCNGFSFPTLIKEHFKSELLVPFEFIYIIEETEQEVDVITKQLDHSYAQLSERDMIISCRAGYTIKDKDGHTEDYRSQSNRFDFTASPLDPYLTVQHKYHVPAPANDPIDIVYDGVAQVWPRWLVEMGKEVTNQTQKEHGVYITTKAGVVYEIGFMDPEKLEINSPLMWLLKPSEKVAAFLIEFEATRAKRLLRQRFQQVADRTNQQTEAAEHIALEHYLEAVKQAGIARKGVDGFIDEMFSELETAFKEDGQIIAIGINGNAEVEAIVGPIITLNKKDYGYFWINVSKAKARPITHEYKVYRHPNINGSYSFCMGGTGGDEFGDMIKGGHFASAIAYFIYRLSAPTSDGYSPYEPTIQPEMIKDYTQLLERAINEMPKGIWNRARDTSEIKEAASKTKFRAVRKTPRKAADLPLLANLRTITYDEFDNICGNSEFFYANADHFDGLEIEDTIREMFEAGEIPDVFRVILNNDEDDFYVHWERPRDSYRLREYRPRNVTTLTVTPFNASTTAAVYGDF